MPDHRKLRHHHHRRRFRRLHARGPAERGQGHAGAAARSRRLGSAIPGSRFRSAGRGSCSTASTTGCISPSPKPRPAAAASNARAAGSSAARPRSMPWPMCAATRATTTAGPRPGSPTWSYAHVLPYFRRQESWKGGASFYRGGDGPLATQMTGFSDPLVDAFAASGRAAGYKATPDYNGAQQEGFGVWQMTVKDGRRCSAADAYLRPALERPNLTVETGALATKIIFDGRRAVGVEYVQRGKSDHGARRPRSDLVRRRHQFAAASDAVGHRRSERTCRPRHRRQSGAAGRRQEFAGSYFGGDRLCAQGAGTVPSHDAASTVSCRRWSRAYRHGEGPATELPTGTMAFLKSRPDAALPDVQLIFNAAPMTAAPYLWPFRRAYADSYACRAAVLRPESRGRVELVSADPYKAGAHPPEFPRHRQ